MNKEIHTYRLRYLIPFTFQNYQKLYNTLKNSEDWAITNVLQQQEQDVYSFILNSFSTQESETHPGSAWLLSPYEKDGRLPVLSYHAKDDVPLKLSITEAGLFLFQSCVGFFWYEIQMGKSITPTKLIEIQNQIKELNRHANIEHFFLISEENIRFTFEKEALLEQEPENTRCFYCKTPYPCYIKWSDIIHVDSSENTAADSLLSYEDLEPVRFYPDHKTGNYGFVCNRLQKFTLGNWIASLLYALSPNILFFTEKKNCLCSLPSLSEYSSYPAKVPDRALLFTYAVFDLTQTDAGSELLFLESAFNLTNGYKESYEMNTHIESDMYRPFQNTIWYATREGCGYYVKTEENASDFFRHNMKQKIMNDYFILYVILLYQSYSLLRFSKLTVENLSAVSDTYTSDPGRHIKILQKLNCEINTFLVKGIHTSVSSVNHQNLFFHYVMQALHIESDIKSVTLGLDALLKLQNEIEKQQATEIEKEGEEARRATDDAMNNSLGLLSMLAIISALTDGLGFLSEINAILLNGTITPVNIITLVVFAFLALLILRVSYPAIKFYWFRYRERKKHRK